MGVSIIYPNGWYSRNITNHDVWLENWVLAARLHGCSQHVSTGTGHGINMGPITVPPGPRNQAGVHALDLLSERRSVESCNAAHLGGERQNCCDFSSFSSKMRWFRSDMMLNKGCFSRWFRSDATQKCLFQDRFVDREGKRARDDDCLDGMDPFATKYLTLGFGDLFTRLSTLKVCEAGGFPGWDRYRPVHGSSGY